MNCPKCGAEKDGYNASGESRYKCLSWFDEDGKPLDRSNKCYEREIARKDALLEMTRNLLYRRAWVSKIHLSECACQECEDISQLLDDMEAGPTKNNIVVIRKEALEDILWWVEQVREDYEEAATGPPLKKEGDWDPTTLMYPQFYEELKKALADMEKE